MQYYGIDWLATVCGLAGVYLLGNKNKYGFRVVYGGEFELDDVRDFDGQYCHDYRQLDFFYNALSRFHQLEQKQPGGVNF